MHFQDFVIPLNREELLKFSNAGHFYVEEEFSSNEIREKLEEAKTAFDEEGVDFIIHHFATFFSLLQKFKNCSQLTREKEWNIIKNAFKVLLKDLQILFEDFSNLDSENQRKLCNITKMLVYILLETMKSNENLHVEQNSNPLDVKTKKKQPKMQNEQWNWNSEKYEAFKDIYAFLELPFKLLWEPPVVDEEFINMIANFCYTCLEDPGISNNNTKVIRETIFQILGLLIKNYLHGLSFCVKIVQLLKMNDHLVNVLAQGIIQIYKICNCTNIIKEIVREIADTDEDQLAADTSGTRNVNLFLLQLAETVPSAIIPAIELLISHLHGDSYSMRICVIGVLGEIVLNVLTKENLDDSIKKMRDDYLDCLEEHIYDVNAFVRTKVLSVWQKLCTGKAIPISRLNGLLEMTIGRLNDKSINVKKQAVHLIKDLLEGNPFCGELNSSEILQQLQEERKQLDSIKKAYNLEDYHLDWEEFKKPLQKLMVEFDKEKNFDLEDVHGSSEKLISCTIECLRERNFNKAIGILIKFKNEFYEICGINEKTLSPEIIIEILQKIYEVQKENILFNVPIEARENIEKHNNAIEYLQSALEFSKLIDRALPIILTFLDSNAVTDVLEAIHFFTAAYLFGFKQAAEGIRKMLYLIFSKESSVKAAVSVAYQDLYFQSTGSERQQSITTVQNLGELILTLNYNQLDALEEVVKEWVKKKIINENHVQVMFERFSMKIPGTNISQSWASLVLIRMIGAEEHKIIKNNLTVLLNEGLKKNGLKNFLMVKEICKALQHLLPTKEQGKFFDQTLRYSEDHEIFKMLFNLLKIGIWKIDDLYYIPMAEEAINLVFAICDRPDEFCKNLIVELHQNILNGKRPTEKNISDGNVLNNMYFDDCILEDSNKNNLDNFSKTNLSFDEVEKQEDQDQFHVHLLARFISILGQVASNYVMYLEGPVLDEFKLRNQLEFERKLRKFEENEKNVTLTAGNKGMNDTEIDKTLNECGIEHLEFNRGTADDADADEMKIQTETNIVTGDGLLAKFSNLIVTVCKNPGKYNDKALQNAALLALAKFMHVSSVFCEENLPLLVTICEKSQSYERQENAVIALGALHYRFPNNLEPWTPHMREMLLNPNRSVRYSSIMILTDLIVNEMVKARNYISNLAICIVDKEIKIARVARHFFREFSQKGNSLFNVLPVLISDLTQRDFTMLASDDFKIIMKYVLGLITKEKQSEHLIEKLCQYFESATTEKQWCDLAYCLSLLHYGDKGLRKILDNVKCFLDKLYLAEVYEAFCAIVSESNKNPQKDKALVDELDAVIKEHRGKNTFGGVCAEKNFVQSTSKKKQLRRKYLPSDSDQDDSDEKSSLRKQKNEYEKKELSENDQYVDDFFSDESSGRIILRSRVIKSSNKRNDALEKNVDSTKKEIRKKSKNVLRKRTKHKVLKYQDSSEEYDTESEKKEKKYFKALK